MDVERVQRVAEFVGDAGGEQGEGGQFLRLDGGGGLLAALGHVAQDQGHAGDQVTFLVDQRHDVETEEPVLGIKHLDLVADHLAPFAAVGRPDPIPVQVAQVLGDRFATAGLGIEPEQPPGGGVGITDPSVGVDDQDTFLQGVEQGFEKPFLPREFQHHALQALRVDAVEAIDDLVEKR